MAPSFLLDKIYLIFSSMMVIPFLVFLRCFTPLPAICQEAGGGELTHTPPDLSPTRSASLILFSHRDRKPVGGLKAEEECNPQCQLPTHRWRLGLLQAAGGRWQPGSPARLSPQPPAPRPPNSKRRTKIYYPLAGSVQRPIIRAVGLGMGKVVLQAGRYNIFIINVI